jgi:hypothetical protein
VSDESDKNERGGHWVTAAIWWAIATVFIGAFVAQTYTNVSKHDRDVQKYEACLEAHFTPKDCKR